MRKLLFGLAVLLAACGGGEERTLEEWVAWEDGGQADPEHVECVADGLRQELSSSEIDELTGLNLREMSEEEMMENHSEVLNAHADVHFECIGPLLGG